MGMTAICTGESEIPFIGCRAGGESRGRETSVSEKLSAFFIPIGVFLSSGSPIESPAGAGRMTASCDVAKTMNKKLLNEISMKKHVIGAGLFAALWIGLGAEAQAFQWKSVAMTTEATASDRKSVV